MGGDGGRLRFLYQGNLHPCVRFCGKLITPFHGGADGSQRKPQSDSGTSLDDLSLIVYGTYDRFSIDPGRSKVCPTPRKNFLLFYTNRMARLACLS
jgi:hypothetical protein